MSSNQTKKYVIRGFSEIINLGKIYKDYSRDVTFCYFVSANSVNQAISRFQLKFDSNFCLNWMFEIYLFDVFKDDYSDNCLKTFFWDFKYFCYSQENPINQLKLIGDKS